MILAHSSAGTLASFLGGSFGREPRCALADLSKVFARSRRALFFRALVEGEVLGGDSERSRFDLRGGVDGAACPACLNLSNSALDLASFHNCLWWLSTSNRADEKVVKVFRWSEFSR